MSDNLVKVLNGFQDEYGTPHEYGTPPILDKGNHYLATVLLEFHCYMLGLQNPTMETELLDRTETLAVVNEQYGLSDELTTTLYDMFEASEVIDDIQLGKVYTVQFDFHGHYYETYNPDYGTEVDFACHYAMVDVLHICTEEEYDRNDWPVVIIPCGGKKGTTRNVAHHLYEGSYFQACKRWALSKTVPENIYILSARHGLMDFFDIIDPYDVQWKDKDSIDIETVYEQATHLIHMFPDREIICIGGHEYRRRVAMVFAEAREVIYPMPKGLGIGQQLKWMKEDRQ